MSLRCICNKPLKDHETDLCQECDNIVQDLNKEDAVLQEILDEIYYENNSRDFD